MNFLTFPRPPAPALLGRGRGKVTNFQNYTDRNAEIIIHRVKLINTINFISFIKKFPSLEFTEYSFPMTSTVFVAHSMIVFIPGTKKCRNVMSVSPAPASGRVTFMPGSVAGEIPADPRKTASDLPGSGVAKRPGSRLNRGRDPGRALQPIATDLEI